MRGQREGPPRGEARATLDDASDAEHGDNNWSGKRKQVANKELTAARLKWLEQFFSDTSVSLDIRCALLLALRYTSMPDSRERFERDGVPVAWPPQQRLAKATGSTRQAVSAAMKRLEKRGYVKVLKNGLGRGIATEYSLVIKGNELGCLLEEDKRQRGSREKATTQSGKGKNTGGKRQPSSLPHSLSPCPYKNPSNHSREPLSDFSGNFLERVKMKTGGSAEETSHPVFDELFESWPNPDKDRGKALGAWINHVLKRKVEPKFVQKSARRWIRHWADEDASFIPYLGKWLGEHTWEEQPLPNPLGEHGEVLHRTNEKRNRSENSDDYQMLRALAGADELPDDLDDFPADGVIYEPDYDDAGTDDFVED